MCKNSDKIIGLLCSKTLCKNAKLTCVSVNIKLVATSNLFGLERYLFCLNCFSNSNSCCEVKAVLGLLVLPNSACPGPQPVTKLTIELLVWKGFIVIM